VLHDAKESSNNRIDNNKTPTVILQDDVHSYEILYGNKVGDNQINMVNIIDPSTPSYGLNKANAL
jgi:hypothetical protein